MLNELVERDGFLGGKNASINTVYGLGHIPPDKTLGGLYAHPHTLSKWIAEDFVERSKLVSAELINQVKFRVGHGRNSTKEKAKCCVNQALSCVDLKEVATKNKVHLRSLNSWLTQTALAIHESEDRGGFPEEGISKEQTTQEQLEKLSERVTALEQVNTMKCTIHIG